MRKDRLYLYTILSLLVIVFIVGYFSMNYTIRLATKQLLNSQIEFSKREAKEIANIVSNQVENNIDKQTIVNNIQKSIENTDISTGFICMFDKYGKEICHPDIERVGKVVVPDQSYISGLQDDLTTKDFYNYLEDSEEVGGIRDFKNSEKESEIVYLFPVKNTDWIIASHANIKKIHDQIHSLKANLFLVFLTTGVLVVLLSLTIIRIIGSKYEKRLEDKNEELSNELVNVSKLNHDLLTYKAKMITKKEEELMDEPLEIATTKKRILSYLKNELVTLEVENIAYIYVDNTITYLKDIDGKVSNSNSSLEELYSGLDNTVFFRANRQFILSIKSINKIIKYGNNQLKIEVLPKSEIDIIISKNRAAEFKNWLNK